MPRGCESVIIEVNAEPTPLTERGISDYLQKGKTGETWPKIVDEVKSLMDTKNGSSPYQVGKNTFKKRKTSIG